MSLGQHNFPYPSGRGGINPQDDTQDTPALSLSAVAGAGANAAAARPVSVCVPAAVARPVSADRGAVAVAAVRAEAARPPDRPDGGAADGGGVLAQL